MDKSIPFLEAPVFLTDLADTFQVATFNSFMGLPNLGRIGTILKAIDLRGGTVEQLAVVD